MSENRINRHKSVVVADRLSRWIAVLFVAVLVVLTILRAGNLWSRHDDILLNTRHQAESFAHVLNAHLSQQVATIDATLAQIRLHSERVGGPNAQPPFWQPVLRAAFAGLTGAKSLSIINDAGIVTHSTVDGVIGQSRSNQYLYRHLKENPATDLVADTPFRSTFGDGMLIPFGRRLSSPGGNFDGFAVATFGPEQMRDFYRSVDIDVDGRISILHPEGIVLFNEPSNEAETGRLVHDNPLFRAAIEGSGDGFLRGPLESGGRNYLSAYRTVRNANLILTVSMSEDRALAAWSQEVRNSIGYLIALGAIFLFAGYLINREIRARAAADQALRENQASFDEMMYRAPVLVTVKDTEGRFKFMNKAMEELLGLTREEAMGKTLSQMSTVNTGSPTLISLLDQEVVETKAPLQRELNYPTQGGMRTALFVKFPLFDRNGEVESVASFSTDLTEQRRAATWFHTIMDNAPALIAIKDVEGRFIFVNRAQEAAAGIPASDFLGRTSRELFAPEYAEMHDQFDREVLAAGAPVQREFTAPYTQGERTLLFVKFPVFNANGNIESIGSIATDVTAQKKAETQLVHAQRMEAVGQLTGGIAHDFNNLLTVMIGNSELLTAALADNDRLEPLARVTLEAAERSAALTQRLLAFGRRQMLAPKATDVGKLVDDMLDLIVRAAGIQAKVSILHSESGLWPALVDPGQLETAIINLVVNSRDAMPVGGRITIELGNVEIDEKYVERNPDAKTGDYVAIAVTDTGTGMPAEVVERVFEPFFTTKEAGKGTGLGLPTIYGFVRQSGGHVKIESEVGGGTVVRIYIPRANAPSIVPELPSDPPEQLPRGRESILLVEDDRAVRDFTENLLLDLGYRVSVASDPGEALKLSLLVGRPDLLVTDVIMAGPMNGRQLAERMCERWPDLRVLYVSGYADGVLPELADGRAGGTHFLAKPFRRHDLARKVREALDTETEVVPFSA
jgi:PAS domain S-box-containing protein